MDRKLLLQTPVEQSRLLHEVPEVIADNIEGQPACKDTSTKDRQTDLPKSSLKGTSQPPIRSSEGIKSPPCCLDDGANVAGNRDIVTENSASELIKSGSAHKDDQSREMEERAAKKQYEGAFEEVQQQSHTRTHGDKDDGIIQTKRKQCFEEVNKNHLRASPPKIFSGQTSIPFSQGMPSAFLPQEQCQSVTIEEVDIERQNKKQRTPRDGSIESSEPRFKLISLSDNGEVDPSVAAKHTDKQHYKGPASEENFQLHSLGHDTKDDCSLRIKRNEVCQVKHTNTGAVHVEPFPAKIVASISPGQFNVLPQEQYQPGNDISETKQNGQVNVALENKKQSAPTAGLIVLSDDEKEDSSAAANKQTTQDINCSIWYCISPHGMKTGPYSMLVLKEWSDGDSCVLKWKVCKSGESIEEAISLNDALHQVFHGRKY
ncbi:unnamed protein product [Dovyalis caffra]|uniref:Uncharacterized protein n=1 Tax=Dovyalis caffra TaxID=77055 RepID=A0AAV1SJ42_9ROSI|nr:unnamed protein product [Dovyalis caffra]